MDQSRVLETDYSYLMLYLILFKNFHLIKKDFIVSIVDYDLIFAELLGK